MLEASRQTILERLSDSDLVLDVGGWGKPFPRADWVIDLMPYESRGGWGGHGSEPERFTHETWIQRDICATEPWPFADDQFDFAICSHTLEDVRDPIRVCEELNRVAKAGYIEVPSRLEEQAWGVVGEWVGWSHHHWLIDVDEADGVTFFFKPHTIHADRRYHFEAPLGSLLSEAERVETLFWEGSFGFRERLIFDRDEALEYLARPVREHRDELRARLPEAPRRGPLRRIASALRRRRLAGGEAGSLRG